MDCSHSSCRIEDKGVFLYCGQGADSFIVFKINVNLVSFFLHEICALRYVFLL